MSVRRKALVCGAGGFIGHALVKRLVAEGYWVRGIDIGHPDFEPSPAHDFRTFDLRDGNHLSAFAGFDEVYQLAADMGGAGFVFSGENDADILRNSVRINAKVLESLKTVGWPRKLFFSSSACIYPHHTQNDPFFHNCAEGTAYPADPCCEYGWEKLFSERMYLAHAKQYGVAVRIARFHNTYGPGGVFDGGREKAPAALCRKIAQATKSVEIWGDGQQTRTFLYIDDCIDGVRALMNSSISTPVNIGSVELVSINDLAYKIMHVAGKELAIVNLPGPQGVRGRRSMNKVMNDIGWEPRVPLIDGLRTTYQWIVDHSPTRAAA
jgi:nucleoside-diphosphate-sugar epimerase